MRLVLLSLLLASLTVVGFGVAIGRDVDLDSRGNPFWPTCTAEYDPCSSHSECCYKHCATDGVCEVSHS